MAVLALGYIAVRLVGSRYGLPLTSWAAGLISSIANHHVSMGARGAEGARRSLLPPAVAGAVLSSIATTVQLASYLPHQPGALAGCLSAAGLFPPARRVSYCAVSSPCGRCATPPRTPSPPSRLSVRTALTLFAAILAVVIWSPGGA